MLEGTGQYSNRGVRYVTVIESPIIAINIRAVGVIVPRHIRLKTLFVSTGHLPAGQRRHVTHLFQKRDPWGLGLDRRVYEEDRLFSVPINTKRMARKVLLVTTSYMRPSANRCYECKPIQDINYSRIPHATDYNQLITLLV